MARHIISAPCQDLLNSPLESLKMKKADSFSSISSSEQINADLDICKKVAAEQAVKDHLVPLLSENALSQSRKPIIFGVGSGSTIGYALDYLAKEVDPDILKSDNLICIPTSFQARQLINQTKICPPESNLFNQPTPKRPRTSTKSLGKSSFKLSVGDLTEYPAIDLTIDGADDVEVIFQSDEDKSHSPHVAAINCIKGGGGCHFQEKLVASASSKLVIVCDWRKNRLPSSNSTSPLIVSTRDSYSWQKGIPVEVVPLAWKIAQAKIFEKFSLFKLSSYGDKNCCNYSIKSAKLRPCNGGKAGPVVTDFGNFIIDLVFSQSNEQVDSLNDFINLDIFSKELKCLPGIVETGLFINVASCVYFGQLSEGNSKDNATTVIYQK